MSKYYGLGTKVVKQKVNGVKVQETVDVVIGNLSDSYVDAVNSAKEFAAKNGITFQGVYLTKNYRYGGDTMTKEFKERRKMRGLTGGKYVKSFMG